MKATMRGIVWLVLCAPAAAQEAVPDRAAALEAFAAGRWEEALRGLRAASEANPDDAELAWDLALAAWRAGETETAETAAERAATLSDGRFAALRDGLVGNLRFEKALATRAEDPAAALELARAARDRYLLGAKREPGRASLVRNLERANRLVAELEQQQEEQQQQEQQQDQQQPQDQPPSESEPQEQEQQQEQPQDQKQPSDAPPEGEPKPDDGQGQQEPPPEGPPSEPPPEPEPGETEPPPEPQPEQGPEQQEPGAEPPTEPPPGGETEPPSEPEMQPGEQPPDGAPEPGETPPVADGPPTELSPEQMKRLLEALENLEAQREALRRAARDRRPPVRRDW